MISTYLRDSTGFLSRVKVIFIKLMLCFLLILFRGPISSFFISIFGSFSSFQRNSLARVVTQASMSPAGDTVSLCGGEGRETGGRSLEPVLDRRCRVASLQLSMRWWGQERTAVMLEGNTISHNTGEVKLAAM